MTELKPVYCCGLCGSELYCGSFCYHLDGLRICPDCLTAFALRYFRGALEVVV